MSGCHVPDRDDKDQVLKFFEEFLEKCNLSEKEILKLLKEIDK